MKRNGAHSATLAQVCFAVLLFCGSSFSPFKAYGQSIPTLYVPGAIATSATSSAAPAFTPNGNIVYFGQSSNGKGSSIVTSERSGANWSAVKTAAFSGHYRDLEPAFAPSGRYLVFASNRPSTPRGGELDGNYNGQTFTGMGGNLWKIEFKKGKPQGPEWLSAVINSNSSVFSPAIAADGSLYFMRADNGGKFHIYRAQMKQGKYETPQLASFSDPNYGDYDPAVAPDESYLIFSSGRPPAPKTTDLFIVFRTTQGWGKLIDLRFAISENVYGIEARLSPDGKTLYFSNSRNASGENVQGSRFIWKVDLSDLLQKMTR